MSHANPEGKRKPRIVVAAGVVIEGGRVLLTQRKAGSHLAGSWEFPGGKVEDGEDPRAALVRELEEELGILADAGDPLEVTAYEYEKKEVLLLFFLATRRPGSPDPRALDVGAFRWAALSEIVDAEFPPADVPVLAKVRALLARDVR